MKYNIVTTDSTEAVAVFVDGELYQATNEHPNWDKIIEAVKAGTEDRIAGLFEFGKAVAKGFERFSERVSYRDGVLLFDNDVVDNALAKRVVAFYHEGLDYAPLVAFFEKVALNPEEHSREQLFRWLERHEFALTEDGDIVAYKGVDTSFKDGFDYISINSGTAVVDGVTHNGRIPQNVGSVVEMPRSQVQHDPSQGCHTGLHAGTWDYASEFSRGAVLLVRINPRDVVSVPTDCYDAKCRVSRYTVEALADGPVTGALFLSNDNADDADEVPAFDEDDDFVDPLYDSYYDDDEDDFPDDEDYDDPWGDGEYDDEEDFDDDLDSGTPVTVTTNWSGTSQSFTHPVDTSTLSAATTYQPKHYRPTNDNHKTQERDAKGHFVKKDKKSKKKKNK